MKNAKVTKAEKESKAMMREINNLIHTPITPSDIIDVRTWISRDIDCEDLLDVNVVIDFNELSWIKLNALAERYKLSVEKYFRLLLDNEFKGQGLNFYAIESIFENNPYKVGKNSIQVFGPPLKAVKTFLAKSGRKSMEDVINQIILRELSKVTPNLRVRKNAKLFNPNK